LQLKQNSLIRGRGWGWVVGGGGGVGGVLTRRTRSSTQTEIDRRFSGGKLSQKANIGIARGVG